MESVLQWASLIRTDGLAVTIVLFLMVVFVMVLRWLGTNVARPLTARGVAIADAHVDYLRESIIATKAITASVGDVKADVGEVRAQLETHGEKLENQHGKISDIHDLLIVRRQGVTQQQVSSQDKAPITQQG